MKSPSPHSLNQWSLHYIFNDGDSSLVSISTVIILMIIKRKVKTWFQVRLVKESGDYFNCIWKFSDGTNINTTYQEFLNNNGTVHHHFKPGPQVGANFHIFYLGLIMIFIGFSWCFHQFHITYSFQYSLRGKIHPKEWEIIQIF